MPLQWHELGGVAVVTRSAAAVQGMSDESGRSEKLRSDSAPQIALLKQGAGR